MILVVDDDPRILSATRQILIDQGHDVVACPDGPSALAALSTHPAIVMIVSDVLMPGMNGTEMVRIATQQRPDLRILFVSGDIGDTPPEEFGGHILLRKPFTAGALSSEVADCLSR